MLDGWLSSPAGSGQQSTIANQHFSLQPFQKIDDLRLRPIHRPNKLAAHDAIAIDDVSLWKLAGSVQAIAFLVWVPHREQSYTVVSQEPAVVVFVGVNAHRQYGHAFGLHALLHLYQRRNFFHAGK